MNHCKIHPEKQAADYCRGCGEAFCEDCLDESLNCPDCRMEAERFLAGFANALQHWEQSLRVSSQEQSFQFQSPRGGKKRYTIPRVVGVILLVLLGAYTVYFVRNYNLFLGQMFLEQGNLQKARVHFEKASERDPENPELKFVLGNIYYQLGALDKSIEAFSTCIRLDSLNAGALNNLAWIYAQLEIKLDKALVFSKRSLEIDPDNPAYLDTLAEIYYLKKEYYRALTYIRKAVDQNPPNLEYYKRRLEKIKRLAYSQRRFLEV